MKNWTLSCWQVLGQLLTGLILCLGSSAQITFRLSDHPNQAGVDTWKIRNDTSGKSITPLLGAPGGPHRWDFSYPMTSNEAVRTAAIVPPEDGGHQAAFPGAAYAERETVESTGCRSWSYLRLTAGSGRILSGAYEACKNPRPAAVFDTPVVETPDNLKFGDEWQQSTQWEDETGSEGNTFGLLVQYTNSSKVDGYGTVVLPGGIGEVPALRVTELTSYVVTVMILPISTTQYFRKYYWMVPGIGRAVQLSSPEATSAPPENFSTSASIFRVFQSSRYPQRQPVENLRIARAGNQILLSWDQDIAATRYAVEYARGLGSAGFPWTALGSPTGNSFSDPLGAAPSRFYRVFRLK